VRHARPSPPATAAFEIAAAAHPRVFFRRCDRREQRRKTHPRTPDVHQSCSKRAFDGQVRKWRRMLHEWDPEAAAAEAAAAAAAAKNGGAARPAGGLPLKMTPAPAPRPAGKRSYAATLVHSAGPAPRPPPAAAAAAAAAALISPPPCPPDAKQARRRAAVPVTAGGAGVGTVLNLAATWRDMSLTPAMAMAGASTIAAADDVDAWFGAPEVCYDEGEGEGGGAEAMQVEGLVA
jgi:hypothetical protein